MNGLDGPPRVISIVSIIMLSRLRLRDKRHHSNLVTTVVPLSPSLDLIVNKLLSIFPSQSPLSQNSMLRENKQIFSGPGTAQWLINTSRLDKNSVYCRACNILLYQLGLS